MRALLVPFTAFWLLHASAQPELIVFDTALVIAGTEGYMRFVDRAPIAATYALMPDKPRAEQLETGAEMPPGALELIELYVDSNKRVVGVGTFWPGPAYNIRESALHYFGPDGNLMSVRLELRWTDSGCTSGEAIKRDYQYFFPPRQPFMEYTTVNDDAGRDLDPSLCRFPALERHADVYQHLDMLLLLKRILPR